MALDVFMSLTLLIPHKVGKFTIICHLVRCTLCSEMTTQLIPQNLFCAMITHIFVQSNQI